MTCRNATITVKVANFGVAFFQFERLISVDWDAPDARRPLIKQVARVQHRSRVALKRLWRWLDADADGFAPE